MLQNVYSDLDIIKNTAYAEQKLLSTDLLVVTWKKLSLLNLCLSNLLDLHVQCKAYLISFNCWDL